MAEMTPASTTIARLHALVKECAPLGSAAIVAELAALDKLTVTEAEFGDEVGDVQVALDTVRSALLALFDAAIEREDQRK